MGKCSVTYENGRIKSVTEDGRTPELFTLINKVIQDKGKAYVVYSMHRDGVSTEARINANKVKGAVTAKTVSTTEQVTERDIVNRAVGVVPDLGNRVKPHKESNLKISDLKLAKILKNSEAETKGAKAIEAIRNTIKGLIGAVTPKSISVGPGATINVGKDSVGDYVYSLNTKGESVGTIRVTSEGKLKTPEVLNIASGQGVGRELLKAAIKDHIVKGLPLKISKQEFKEASELLEAYRTEGVLELERGNYEVVGEKVGGISEAISKANNSPESLSKEDVKVAKNLMMTLGVTTNAELKAKLKTLEVGGVIDFSEANLRKVFNAYEAMKISNDPSLIYQLQEISRGIASTEIEIEYDPTFVMRKGSEMLGVAQKVANPFQVEVQVREAVAGEENYTEALPEEYVQMLDGNKGFKEYVERIAKNYGKPKIYIYRGGELIESRSDTQGRFELVMDSRSSQIAEEMLDQLDEMSQEEYNEGFQEWTKNTLRRLGISTSSVYARIDSVEKFEQVEEMVESISKGEMVKASLIYDKILNNEPVSVAVVHKAKNNDVYIEGVVSEEEVFTKYGLVKISDNLYREVDTTMTSEEMMQQAFESEMNQEFEDFEVYKTEIKSKSASMGMKLNQESSIKNYLYKEFLGVRQTKTERVKQSSKDGVKNVKDLEYLQDEFIKDMSDHIAETDNHLIKVTGKGIEFRYNDQMSIEEALESLPEQMARDLVEYSKISKHMEEISEYKEESLEDLDSLLMHPVKEVEVEFYDPMQELRERAYNNPMSLPALKGDIKTVVTNIGENLISKEGEHRDFLEKDGKTYERVAFEGGVGFYKEGSKTSEIFTEMGMEPVVLETELSELTHLYKEASKPEIKNVFSKGEKAKVEEEYFKC